MNLLKRSKTIRCGSRVCSSTDSEGKQCTVALRYKLSIGYVVVLESSRLIYVSGQSCM